MNPRALYDSDDVDWLRRPDAEVEGQFVERKEDFDPKKLARQVSALANEEPGGLIVIGARSNGVLSGIGHIRPAVESGLSQLRNTVDFTEWNHRFVAVPGTDDELLFIHVPFSAHRVIALSNGTVYRRIGSSSVELKPDEIRELRDARGDIHVELEPALPFSEAAIDRAVAEELLEAITARNGLTLPLTLEDALRNKKLLVTTPRGDHLSVAGVLTLAREPRDAIPGARIRFLRFEGVEERLGTERNVVKDEWFEGPILLLERRFGEFLRTQVRDFDYLGPDGRFVREPEYPESAWREAIINALVHRSYTLKGRPVFVRLFDDRLEVESPGGFPGDVRPDHLVHHPRNPRLADALQYFKLVWQAREGTRRMQKEMERLSLPPPLFEEIDGSSVRVTLRNDIERRRMRGGAEDMRRRWDEVATLLNDDLAIAWRRAMSSWEELQNQGAGARGDVLDRAIAMIADEEVPHEIAEPLTALLQREKPATMGLQLVALANALVTGKLNERPDELLRIASLIARSDEALNLVLDWLEEGVNGAPQLNVAFQAIINRAQVDLPPRPWIDRVLRLARRYPEVANADTLHRLITARPIK